MPKYKGSKRKNSAKSDTMESVVEAIRKYDNYLVTSHINLEGDSLGSQLAIAELLKKLGKKGTLVDSDRVPAHYQFLPNVEMVQGVAGNRKRKFEAAIVLDCPNLKRTGKVRELIKRIPYIINIDHHVSNEGFGSANWIEKDASSVGEMVYQLCKKMNCQITKEAALFLYISILTDTGSFNYSNTSSTTHEIVSKLLEQGVEPHNVSKSIYGSKAIGEIKLLGKALSDLRLIARGKIAYMTVRRKLFNETKTKPVSCENFVNFARSINGVEVALFFREDLKKKNSMHISFRSTGRIDVNKIASCFGGGGHKSAAGCVIKGRFNETRDHVLRTVKNELQKRSDAR